MDDEITLELCVDVPTNESIFVTIKDKKDVETLRRWQEEGRWDDMRVFSDYEF